MRTLELGKFVGKIQWSTTAGPFVLVRCHYSPLTYFSSHFHTEPSLVFVESGSLHQPMDNDVVLLREGLVGFHPSDHTHRNYAGSRGAVIWNVAICSEWLDEQARRRRLATDRRAFYIRESKRERWGQLNELSSVQSTREYLERLVAHYLFSRRSEARQFRIGGLSVAERARELVKNRYAERLSLSSVSRELGVNPSHLGRAFRCTYGESVGDFLRFLRLDQACQKLLHSPNSICEIAHDCGFADQSHLTRSMQIAIAQTPARFRKAYCESMGPSA